MFDRKRENQMEEFPSGDGTNGTKKTSGPIRRAGALASYEHSILLSVLYVLLVPSLAHEMGETIKPTTYSSETNSLLLPQQIYC